METTVVPRARGTVPRVEPTVHFLAGQVMLMRLDAHACGTIVIMQMEWERAFVQQVTHTSRYVNSANL